MAEIKSTLELVLERTRNMVFSRDEKREREIADFGKTVSGLVQKVLDGVVRIENFSRELERLGQGVETDHRRVAIDEVSKRLRLDQDNGALFGILGGACHADPAGAIEAIRAYREAREQAGAEISSRILKRFAESHGISGSAVEPNLDKDAEWAQTIGSIQDRYQAMLEGEVAKLHAA